jgi:aminoglycoside phosphotransferase family enzyme/predicted kinase
MSLIENLQNPEIFEHSVERFEVIETHISWVLLTGDYVYKIKKPVDFGFLDFSTLEKRKHYCEEEIRLNRRLAPGLYLEAVSINGSEQHPVLNGDGPVIDYAVKMRQFPQAAQLDRLLHKEGIDFSIIDKLANKVADFHQSIRVAPAGESFGDLSHVEQPVLENFRHIRDCIDDKNSLTLLGKLENWSREQLSGLARVIERRKAEGFVRECHGDMHLRNIAIWHDEIVIFDCIEFNKSFYWIDVISDIAFLVMDLEDRGYAALACRFLNSYLERTGDYEGVRLLRFYKVYRALVRAKVDALRAAQEAPDSDEYKKTLSDFVQYLELAERFTRHEKVVLLINHGLSGSGKSVGTGALMARFCAVQIRSDIERKRLYEISDTESKRSEVNQGIYSHEATRRTYDRLVELASILLASGYSVVVDAANLKSWQRQLFIELAAGMKISCFILDYQASLDTLRQRVRQRAQEGTDASDATLQILEHQLQSQQPLDPNEQAITVTIDTEQVLNFDKLLEQLGDNEQKH